MDEDKPRQLKGKVHGFAGGYGYIMGDDGSAYLVHHMDVDARGDLTGAEFDDQLRPGDVVEFDVAPDSAPGMLVAVRVKLV